MTIRISRELPLFNFEHLDILCAWIGPSCENLWPFEILASFRCSILSITLCYALESNIRVKSYDHLIFSRASVLQFLASQYIMRRNRTSVWQFLTFWNYRQLPLFNFERLDMWCAWMGHPSEKLWPLEFLESFLCSISSVSICYALESDLRVKSYDHLNFSRASGVPLWSSLYVMHLNRTSEWKVITIWISRELLLFNFERLDLLYAWIEPPSDKLLPFKFFESFHCSILSVSIYYALESDLRVKSYDHLNFSRVSGVQFRASRFVMHLNRTFEWKVITIWISRELLLFNFEPHNILCA